MIATLVHPPSLAQMVASGCLIGVMILGVTALLDPSVWGVRRRDAIAAGLIALAMGWHRLEVVRNDCFEDFWRYNIAELQFLDVPEAGLRVVRVLVLPAVVLAAAFVIALTSRRSRLPAQQ